MFSPFSCGNVQAADLSYRALCVSFGKIAACDLVN